MIIIVRDKLYIEVESIKPIFSTIVKAYTYSNPDYFTNKAMGFSIKDIEPTIEHYNIIFDSKSNKKFLVLPRGSYPKLVSIIKKANPNIPIKIKDETVKGYAVDVHLNKDTKLEEQQITIIDLLKKHKGGLAEMSPGGGKTISALGLIADLKISTLILVHEHRLRTQWEKELKQRLTGDFTLGRYDGDKKVDGDICIALIQSVHTALEEDFSFFDKFGMVIIDECHRLPALMYTRAINGCPAQYRIGLTGTVKRQDQKHFLLFDIIGERLISIKPQHLKHRITNFEPIYVNTNITFEAPGTRRYVNGSMKNVVDYVKLLTLLTENEERNELILNNVETNLKDQRIHLVLSDRVNHCKYLYDKLVEKGYKVILLIGETRTKTKWDEIREDTSINVIVAQSSIAAEGLDFPELTDLHLPCPSSNLPKLEQKIGRIRRLVEGKQQPRVWDYIDNNVYFLSRTNLPLLRGAQSRRNFYEKLLIEYNQQKSLNKA